MVCTTPGAVRTYRQRFPELPANRFQLIENGFDEDDFLQARPVPRIDGRFTLLHSGVVYPQERDPLPLLAALAMLKSSARINAVNFRLVFRASGHDDMLRQYIGRFGLEGLVELAPPLPYHLALGEMMGADGLLLLQGASCNAQIPAKLYEYLRAGRPLLALTDASGDTATLLRQHGHSAITAMDGPDAIAAALLNFLSAPSTGGGTGVIASCTRAARTGQLAALFDQLVEEQ
jgi:hypothetical protein